jgi:hypothetical protein
MKKEGSLKGDIETVNISSHLRIRKHYEKRRLVTYLSALTSEGELPIHRSSSLRDCFSERQAFYTTVKGFFFFIPIFIFSRDT